MTTLRFWALCTACAVWALAVFARVEAGYWARRIWRRLARAWMQCDEVQA